MYRVMAMTEGDFDMRSVRFPISGGEPLPYTTAEAFEKRFNVPIYEGYGQTEAAPVITLNRPGARKPGTIGPPTTSLQQQKGKLRCKHPMLPLPHQLRSLRKIFPGMPL